MLLRGVEPRGQGARTGYGATRAPRRRLAPIDLTAAHPRCFDVAPNLDLDDITREEALVYVKAYVKAMLLGTVAAFFVHSKEVLQARHRCFHAFPCAASIIQR